MYEYTQRRYLLKILIYMPTMQYYFDTTITLNLINFLLNIFHYLLFHDKAHQIKLKIKYSI